MTPNPVLLDAIGSAAVAIVSSTIAAPLFATIKRLIGSREHMVTLTLSSGKQVSLELDKRLSEDEVSELVSAAVTSAQAGDDDQVRRTVDASRIASQGARHAAGN